MTSFIHKNLNTARSLAEVIRVERLKHNWTLEDLSINSGVSLRYLQILEKGAYDLLPGEIYSKQFIKKISKVLGFKDSALLELYYHDRETQLSLLKLKTVPIKHRSKKFNWLSPKLIRYSFISLIVLGVVSYFGWEIKNIFEPPQLDIFSPSTETITTDSSLIIYGQTEPETVVEINQQLIITESNGSFNQPVDLNLGLNTFKITAKRKNSKARSLNVSILRKPTSQAEAGSELNNYLTGFVKN